MRIINLLPKVEQREIKLDVITRQVVNFWSVVAISILIVFLLSLGGQFYLRQQIASVDRLIAQQREALKSSDTQELEKQVTDLNAQIRLINQLKSQHLEWSKALVELAVLLPSDMQITVLSLDRETGQISILGNAGSRESVIKFWASVKKSSYFTGIDFPLANLEKPSSITFTFKLLADKNELTD
ncbi:MAG: PilN domain-containing protein [Candidatus Doudnabacteria bacterium]|nr:PilN domain-containing protein [Candidatus Doudnabacteria bacterium]